METLVKTSEGEVTLERLVRLYETYKKAEDKKAVKRLEFLHTPEGIEWNRARSKAYYEKNKDKVKEKNRLRYHAKKNDTNENNSTE